MRPFITFPVILLLIGCDATPIEYRQGEAKLSCLLQSLVVQGYAQRNAAGKIEETAKGAEVGLDPSDGSELDNRLAEGEPNSPGSAKIRVQSSGAFVIEFGEVQGLGIPPYTLTCTGDLNQGVLTSVQVNGTIHRPPSGQRWPIDAM